MSILALAARLRAAVVAGTALAVAAIVAPAPASAEYLKVGVLTCATGPSIGLLITSSEKISCSFVPDAGDPEHYHGQIRKFGLDIGVTAASVIVWAVFAQQSGYQPGSLGGHYAGVSAESSVVVGLGANILVGGNANSMVLQPLSIQGQVGLNLAVGVTELDLVKR
jgi:hypothetical protein